MSVCGGWPSCREGKRENGNEVVIAVDSKIRKIEPEEDANDKMHQKARLTGLPSPSLYQSCRPCRSP